MIPQLTQVIDRKRYSTTTSTLLASDTYWDGSNTSRGGRNRWLYRTASGNYFLLTTTMWSGEHDQITPIDRDEAYELFEKQLTEREVSIEDAFPHVTIEDA